MAGNSSAGVVRSMQHPVMVAPQLQRRLECREEPRIRPKNPTALPKGEPSIQIELMLQNPNQVLGRVLRDLKRLTRVLSNHAVVRPVGVQLDYFQTTIRTDRVIASCIGPVKPAEFFLRLLDSTNDRHCILRRRAT